jgi:hypothetical protein
MHLEQQRVTTPVMTPTRRPTLPALRLLHPRPLQVQHNPTINVRSMTAANSYSDPNIGVPAGQQTGKNDGRPGFIENSRLA